MPLAFESLSHGTISFGFFNIESDMLLCERTFLFADDFSRCLAELAGHAGQKAYHEKWPVQVIDNPADVGDLMGAIHGIRFAGFMGALYRRFPFPRHPADFKQNPEGYKTRSVVVDLIAGYARSQEISVSVPVAGETVDLGIYRFSREQFQLLITYVWRGGYPRWKDEIRPSYVSEMKDKITQNRRGVFEGIDFSSQGD